MIRRNFLQGIVMAGTSSAAALGIGAAAEKRSVSYHAKGFSCATCTVGLDTILSQQKGVVRSKSTYPDGIVVIEFDPRLVSEKALAALIEEQGFRIAS